MRLVEDKIGAMLEGISGATELGRLPLPPSRQPGGELMPLWAAERSGASPKGVNPQKDG